MIIAQQSEETKEFTVDVNFDASARFDVIATSKEEAKEKATDRFEEILIMYDCDYYEVTVEIEEEKPLRRTRRCKEDKFVYSVEVTMEASYATYIIAVNGEEAEERAEEQSEEFYDLRGSSINVAIDISTEVQDD